jgi:hypothetical protein
MNTIGTSLPCLDLTVQGIILDESLTKILLVHEKGEPNGKRPGWALPGGNTLLEHHRNWDVKSQTSLPRKQLRYEDVIADSKKQIKHFLCGPAEIENEVVPMSKWGNWNKVMSAAEEYMGCGDDQQDLLNYLTMIREGLEETGLLLCPVRELFSERVRRDEEDHAIVVIKNRIVAGSIDGRSIETDVCDWYPLDGLPADIYRSHYLRILRGVRMIVQDPLIAKLGVEVAPWR